MLESEVIELVTQVRKSKRESNYIEVKSAKQGCPKIFDTLSSFSNQSGGGRILFGVDESKGFEICGVYDAADLQKRITEQSVQMEPAVRPLCTVADITAKLSCARRYRRSTIFRSPAFTKAWAG